MRAVWSDYSLKLWTVWSSYTVQNYKLLESSSAKDVLNQHHKRAPFTQSRICWQSFLVTCVGVFKTQNRLRQYSSWTFFLWKKYYVCDCFGGYSTVKQTAPTWHDEELLSQHTSPRLKLINSPILISSSMMCPPIFAAAVKFLKSDF